MSRTYKTKANFFIHHIIPPNSFGSADTERLLQNIPQDIHTKVVQILNSKRGGL